MTYKFYLNFKNDAAGLVEISEPVGFDAANFVIEQDKKRYGRDVYYGSEETNLTFYKGLFENANLTHQFEKLTRFYKDYGFESEVEFIVEVNGVTLTVGLLDFQKAETDQLEYFKTKVIQNTQMALTKRREDVSVDVFTDKDLDDNPITPLLTEKILLRAKPVVQVSEWGNKEVEPLQQAGSAFGAYIYIPLVNNLQKYGVEDSFAPFDPFVKIVEPSGSDKQSILYNNRLLTAKNNLSNIKLKIKKTSLIVQRPSFSTSQIIIYSSIHDSNGNFISLGSFAPIALKTFGFPSSSITDQTYDVDVPDITAGESITVMFFVGFNSGTFLGYDLKVSNFKCEGIEITATSTAVDSVISGVRHIDYIKQTFKNATGQNVIAPKYDLGGDFYNNYVFNGKLIRQFKNEPFYSTIKNNMEQLQELNSDYQINKENVYIGQYSDFYTNNEIGAYLTAPDSDFKVAFNDRYTVQTVEYKYKSFEQDKDSSNTIDAIHTDTQWLLPNKQVEGNLKILIPFVRDPFEIEFSRRNSVSEKDTTSLTNDDKIYILDVVELPDGARNFFTRLLKYQVSSGANRLKILTDGTFNWLLLGFEVGDIISVKVNTLRNYEVMAIELNMITLRPVTGTITDSGSSEKPIFIDYPLTSVFLVNRTNEGFSEIENIARGDNFSNLKYSIKRNLTHWYSYFKTASIFSPNGKIKNTYFKSNKRAGTKLDTETILKIEGDDILIADLGNAILTPYVYSGKLIASFDDVKETLDKMQVINPDDSIGGFVRIMDNKFRVLKIYPKKLDYTFATAELDTIGEEMQESEFLTIDKIGEDLIKINEVGYDQKIIKPLQLRTNGDYIQILDARGVGLNNEIKYDKVKVNSIIFSNIVELSEFLLNGL